MIKIPDLTLNILKFFASNEIPYPPKMTPDDLSDKFEDCGRNKLYFYVDCAIDYVL